MQGQIVPLCGFSLISLKFLHMSLVLSGAVNDISWFCLPEYTQRCWLSCLWVNFWFDTFYNLEEVDGSETCIIISLLIP